MQVFGHRGSPGYPRRGENTIRSFALALEAGAHGIELDVRRCGDGQIIVIHDNTLNRTTNGSGAISTLPYSDIRRWDAGYGESVPLLASVLDRFAGNCTINIELKDAGLVHDVLQLIDKHAVREQIVISAFDWEELRTASPQIATALLADNEKVQCIGVDRLVAVALEFHASAPHVSQDAVDNYFIHNAHEAGLAVRAYTVNDTANILRLFRIGTDAIFTDLPLMAMRTLAAVQ